MESQDDISLDSFATARSDVISSRETVSTAKTVVSPLSDNIETASNVSDLSLTETITSSSTLPVTRPLLPPRTFEFRDNKNFKLLEKIQHFKKKSTSGFYSKADIKSLLVHTHFLSQLGHILCLTLPLAIYTLIPPGKTSWHPFIMSFCFSFLNIQAVLLFSPDPERKPDGYQSLESPANSSLLFRQHLTELKRRSQTVKLHFLVQTLSLMISLGSLKFTSHLNTKKMSLHIVTGYVTIILNILQCFLGLASLNQRIQKLLFQGISPKKIRLVHACFGFMMLNFSAVSQISAFYSSWFHSTISNNSFYKFMLSFVPVFQSFIILNQLASKYLIFK